MLVLNVKLQVIFPTILLWTQEALEPHLINAAALRMPPQVIGPGEVLKACLTLEHCLDQVVDTTALLVSLLVPLKIIKPGKVLWTQVALEHCLG